MSNTGSPKHASTERFIMPTDEQLIKLAMIFNTGTSDYHSISNMVAMCKLVIERLHENGDVMMPSSKED